MLDVSCDDGCRGGLVCFNGVGGCDVDGGDGELGGGGNDCFRGGSSYCCDKLS